MVLELEVQRVETKGVLFKPLKLLGVSDDE